MTGRIGKLKSRTGCDTCKIRRIRCSEEHPQCKKCSSTGRKCTYTSLVKHRPNYPINPLQPSHVASNATSRERRCFEYYFHHAAPLLSANLDHSFWGVYVLQFCRTEPAIWDSVISLSALIERPPVDHESSPAMLLNAPAAVKEEYHRDALTWYSRSLAGLRQRLCRGWSADVDVILVGTIIYVVIEFLQANHRAVLGLYRHGTKLLAGNWGDSRLKNVVRTIFRRLRTQVLIFSSLPMDDEDLEQPMLNNNFESIDTARNALFELISDMKQLLTAIKAYRSQTGSTCIPSSHALTSRQIQLKQHLQSWHDAFTSFQTPETADSTTLVLLMNHTATLIETKSCLSASESAYDIQQDAFKKILEYAALLTSCPSSSLPLHVEKSQPFSFELGSFLPLFITALKCRDPDLRRKALRLLSGSDTSTTSRVTGVQGLFLSRPAAQLVAIIVGLEEGSYPPPQNHLNHTQDKDLLSKVVDDILADKGCIPHEEDRICDFWISSQSVPETPPPTFLTPSTRNQQRQDTSKAGNTDNRDNSWLYYRQYIRLPTHDEDNEETGERKMGYVMRRVRLPDGL